MNISEIVAKLPFLSSEPNGLSPRPNGRGKKEAVTKRDAFCNRLEEKKGNQNCPCGVQPTSSGGMKSQGCTHSGVDVGGDANIGQKPKG